MGLGIRRRRLISRARTRGINARARSPATNFSQEAKWKKATPALDHIFAELYKYVYRKGPYEPEIRPETVECAMFEVEEIQKNVKLYHELVKLKDQLRTVLEM